MNRVEIATTLSHPMGIIYYYCNATTLEMVPLAIIDAELAQDLPDAPTYFKQPFNGGESLATTILFSIGVCATKTGEWNQESFEKCFETLGDTPMTQEIALKFLNGKYKFESYR